jgi:hypothetical protein
MRFEEYTLSRLVPYILSERYEQSAVIPITPHRAQSQTQNPRAGPDDIVLIVAYNDKDEIIGYIGALPDWLNGDSQKKIAWNSCWWIDPQKGREAAMPLFYRFLDRWDRKVIFSELTPQTFQIITRMEFFDNRIMMGCRGYLRLPLSEILPLKKNMFRSIRWLLYAIDNIFNLFWEIRLIIWNLFNKAKSDVEWQFVGSIDDEIAGLISYSSETELIKRGEAELTWIRDHPWVVEGKPDIYAKRYHFTSHTRHFCHQWVKIISGNDLRAFLIITLKDGHLKVPYLYYLPGSLPDILNLLLHYMISNKVLYVSIYHEDLADCIMKSKTPMLHKKLIPRYTAISKDLSDLAPKSYFLQDGDGDCVFT